MTTLILVGILLPVLLLGALCVWLAVRLQRAERELEVWRAVRQDVAKRIENKIERQLWECRHSNDERLNEKTRYWLLSPLKAER